MTEPKPDGHHFIHCETHGTKAWEGDVVCAPDAGGCGRVWNLDDDRPELQPGAEHGTRCVCGCELSPDAAHAGEHRYMVRKAQGMLEDDEGPPPPLTARLCCRGCAEAVRSGTPIDELPSIRKRDRSRA